MVDKDGTAETRGIAKEIAISRCLAAECPAIVHCDGFSVQPPHVLVVMELCEMGCLMDVLEKHDIPYYNRLRLGYDCASAVAHVHKLGFVHRDIKSLNFFCTQSRQSSERKRDSEDPNPMAHFELRCLLGDFGETVKTWQAEAEAPKQHGTVEWMAPEILCNWRLEAEGDGTTYSTAADCYSLSVVLWECLTWMRWF